MTASSISSNTCFIRGTHAKKGRTQWLTPESGAVRELHYGRIILDAGAAPVQFENGTHETGLICLNGRAEVMAGGSRFTLGLYDSLYVPRDSSIEVTALEAGCDLAEISAPVEHSYPLQFIPYENVKSDPGLRFQTGATSFERTVNILIGKNVQAGRILAGVTFSQPGNWTSWPPHEHAEILEEAYVYIAMPAPAWGTQFVYTDAKEPELVQVVREGDCVVMPAGYHPNVAAPGGSINFLWIMAAHREVVDRQFGVVNVQPEYAGAGSGLESGLAAK
ncbi:MAG TPA: 5-deoxy-glucuronate isomerase [Bryobacteraceae bacterium]|nr:5-deoxy-glucuronate isomerase [Bryobacteraceae bacterium]